MIFKGTEFFQFPEAVVLVRERKPTLHRTRFTTSSRSFIEVETAGTPIANLGSER